MRAGSRSRGICRRLILTTRDRTILRLVHDHRFLTRPQLQRLLHWTCISRVNLRLRKLFDAQFLDRRYVPVLKGSSPAIYLLGKSAVAALADDLGIAQAQLERFRHQDKRYSDAFMRHATAVSEFAAAVQSTAHAQIRFQWLMWLNDRQLLEKCNASGAFNGNSLKPDGYGRYAVSDKAFNFFLELDTGSESIARIRRKLEFYRNFHASGAFHERFGMRAFRILVVTLTAPRAHSLSQLLPRHERPRTWVAHLAAVVNTPLFAAAWYPAGESNQVPLHDDSIRSQRSEAA